MNIDLREITIRDLVQDYRDDGERGVKGYGGRLDIRPPFQREFVYNDAQRDAVIETVTRDFPLNVMYWAVRDDGTFEIIDGQQRTISICQYVQGEFSIEGLAFHNLQDHEKNDILNYELTVYVCKGNKREKLDWFRIVNIAGVKLTDQELRNAVYHGPWVSDAKRYFSRQNGPAHGLGGGYMRGDAKRQEYLETVIDWISGGNIEEHMSRHQHDGSATTLWEYFRSVIQWVQATFPEYRNEMKGLAWGPLHARFKDADLDPDKLEAEISRLMEHDDEITKLSGVYAYVLDGDESHLSIRSFTSKQKTRMYERQRGICPICKGHFRRNQMHGDHIRKWHEGGRTVPKNGRMLCAECNLKLGG